MSNIFPQPSEDHDFPFELSEDQNRADLLDLEHSPQATEATFCLFFTSRPFSVWMWRRLDDFGSWWFQLWHAHTHRDTHSYKVLARLWCLWNRNWSIAGAVFNSAGGTDGKKTCAGVYRPLANFHHPFCSSSHMLLPVYYPPLSLAHTHTQMVMMMMMMQQWRAREFLFSTDHITDKWLK